MFKNVADRALSKLALNTKSGHRKASGIKELMAKIVDDAANLESEVAHKRRSEVSMLAVNALATDNRLDERRHDILRFLDEVSLNTENILDKKTGNQLDTDINYATPLMESFWMALDDQRFQTLDAPSPVDDDDIDPSAPTILNLNRDLIGPMSDREEGPPIDFENTNFCSVMALRDIKYLPELAVKGWERRLIDDGFNSPSDFRNTIGIDATGTAGNIEKLWRNLELAGQNWVVYPEDSLVRRDLTWLAPIGPYEQSILDMPTGSEKANHYRDRAGLGHYGQGDHLVARIIPGKALKNAVLYRPRFADNPRYPWFTVGALDAPRKWRPKTFGQTCCLEALRGSADIASGLPEVVALSLSGKQLNGEKIFLRYLGRVSEPVGDSPERLREKLLKSYIEVVEDNFRGDEP